ncbi:amino acid ABC transporter permease [Rhodovarius crocodyli]|uniref:Amino acid ABC transporter permease n=1 Tax=Rhodovarius crocodyli TaxID=1979269 RepID=A0A437M273_9PROT|nr:amino acid ABC transporter permease [Rhodovarius crocodyli]RVT91614.1 amino acid ABC transporter permease [Rhodovarius crocodyli]
MSFPTILLWLLQGLGVTMAVTALSALVVFPFALVFGVLEYRLRGIPRFLVTVFIDFWRSSSVIILLFFFFYVGPAFDVFLSAYAVGALVIGCNIGAYGSQALRSALETIPAGQKEAGRALGLSRNRILFLIELPQALRKVIPIAGNEVIEIVKTSANVSLIGLADVTFKAKEAMQASHQPAEIYSALLGVYIAICLPMALAIHALVRRGQARRA